MPIGQDEDIRIYQLPEAQELTAGMKVAVDSETDGTKSFDLTTAMSEKAGVSDTKTIELQYDGSDIILPNGVTWKEVVDRVASSYVKYEHLAFTFTNKEIYSFPSTPSCLSIQWNYFDIEGRYVKIISAQLDPETYEYYSSRIQAFSNITVGSLIAESGEGPGDATYLLTVTDNGETYTGSDAYRVLCQSDKNTFSILYGTYGVYFPQGANGYNHPLKYASGLDNDGSYQIITIAADGTTTGTVKNFSEVPASTVQDEGKVLAVDSNGAAAWENPPEGVYTINYSEVTDIRDVDIEKATTIPTFLKIDTEQPLTLNVAQSSGNPYTVNVQPGTIMSLEEIGYNSTSGTYTGPRFLIFGSRYGNGNSGGLIQTSDLRIICCISLPDFGGVAKAMRVNGNMNTTGKLFDSLPPFPITTSFFSGKGPGNPNTNRTQNALGVEFQSNGKIRKQVLMPEDIESHDFSTDATPEQIQFMGWGATSNRAGYKTINEVPASTAQDEGKVLTVDSNGAAAWSTLESSSVEIVSVSDYSSSTSDLYDYLVSLFNAGKTAILKFDGYNIGQDSYYTVTRYSHTQYGAPDILAVSISQAISQQSIDEEIIESLNINSSGYTWNYRRVLDLIDNGTKSESDISSGKIDITRNNTNTIVTLTSVSALTLKANFYGIPNLVIELDNTSNQSNVALTLKDGNNNTMRHSASAGNVAQAGKYYQVTCVGSCWTLAEFTVPTT